MYAASRYITGKNPSVLRTLTANRNTNPNPTNPMDFFFRLTVLVRTA